MYQLNHPSLSTSEIAKEDNRKSHIDFASASTTALEITGHPVQRKHSRMRIEGLNRTRNLKKSIKVMIIIIALFLLSWLPIHLYRLVTTFYPIVLRLFENSVSEADIHLNFLDFFPPNQSIANLSKSKDFVRNVIQNGAIDTTYSFKTLHNRYVFMFFYFMAMSSVCYNPIVYFWMHKKFRTEVKQLFSRIFRCWMCDRVKTRRDSLIVRQNAKKIGVGHMTSDNTGQLLPSLARCSHSSTGGEGGSEIRHQYNKNGGHLPKNVKKKVSYVSSFKIRSKRFSSLSSESTVSSTKKSDHF